MNDSKFCIKCGKQITSIAEFCPSCGAPQSTDSIIEASNSKEAAPSISQHDSWSNIIKQLYSNWLVIKKPLSRYNFWMGELFVFLSQALLYMIVNAAIVFLNQPAPLLSDDVIPILGIILFIIGIAIFIFEVWTSVAIFTSCMRRLKDAAYPMWLILLILIPFIGGIILIFFFCQPTAKVDSTFK